LIREHFAAFKSWLLGDPVIAGFGVEDTIKVSPTGELVAGTYAVLFGGSPDFLGDDRMSAPQRPDSDAEYSYVVRSVSTTPGGVRAMQDRVIPRVVGHRLVVEGRRCSPVHHDTQASDGRPRPNESVKPTLFFADDYFEFVSRRA